MLVESLTAVPRQLYLLYAMSSEEYFVIEQQTIKMHPIKTNSLILDIGGGGEGIIGRLNGKTVVAIDTRIEELAEAKNQSTKVVMDANDLAFLPAAFDVITSFFSLMYIKNKHHNMVFEAIHNVLRSNGKFLVWDVRIPPRHGEKRVFVVPLEIILPNETIETGYGVGWDNKEQDLDYYKNLARRTGFDIKSEWSKDEIFYMELRKRTHNHRSETIRDI